MVCLSSSKCALSEVIYSMGVTGSVSFTGNICFSCLFGREDRESRRGESERRGEDWKGGGRVRGGLGRGKEEQTEKDGSVSGVNRGEKNKNYLIYIMISVSLSLLYQLLLIGIAIQNYRLTAKGNQSLAH